MDIFLLTCFVEYFFSALTYDGYKLIFLKQVLCPDGYYHTNKNRGPLQKLILERERGLQAKKRSQELSRTNARLGSKILLHESSRGSSVNGAAQERTKCGFHLGLT